MKFSEFMHLDFDCPEVLLNPATTRVPVRGGESLDVRSKGNSMTKRVFTLLGPIAVLSSFATADQVNYNCTLNSAASSLVQSTDLAAPFAGTFIGNYDATTTPTGTKTLPGFFGGSVNTAISYSASFALAGDISSHPTGTLVFGTDLAIFQASIGGLNFDMLGAVPGTLGATVNINYQSFHTLQPTAIYPGGVTIPVPVGSGSVTTLRATQTGAPVPALLVQQKNGSFTFTTAVPVEFTTIATLLGQTIADGTPQPGILPLSGTLTVGANNTIALAIAIASQSVSTQPITAPPFVDLPLAIPTVIPAGSTANVLMSGTLTSVTVGSGINATLVAAGQRQPITGDLNGDFHVNSQDLAILLDAWGGTGPADFDGNGIVNSRDLSVILSYWQ